MPAPLPVSPASAIMALKCLETSLSGAQNGLASLQKAQGQQSVKEALTRVRSSLKSAQRNLDILLPPAPLEELS